MRIKHVTGILTIGFTVLSLYAGWEFYHIIIGSLFAWMIVVTFEAGRLTTLFYVIWEKKKWVIPFYILVAVACAGAAFSFFIIQVQMQKEKDLRKFAKPILQIRKAASIKMQTDLQILQNDTTGLKYYNMRLAYWESQKNQEKVAYHEKRIETVRQAMGATRLKYMEIVNAIPGNPKQWIEANGALLRLDMEVKIEGIGIVEKSLNELVSGFTLPIAKKIYGFIFILVIELLIVLLANLTYQNSKEKKKSKSHLQKFTNWFANFTNRKSDLQSGNGNLQNGKVWNCPVCKQTFYRQQIGNHKSRGKCVDIMRKKAKGG